MAAVEEALVVASQQQRKIRLQQEELGCKATCEMKVSIDRWTDRLWTFFFNVGNGTVGSEENSTTLWFLISSALVRGLLVTICKVSVWSFPTKGEQRPCPTSFFVS